MAYVGEVPWHGLGTRVSENVTAKEMIVAAGLDWSVVKLGAPGAKTDDTGTPTRCAVWRADSERKPVVLLGIVSPSYEPVQNADAFAFFEPLLNRGFARFHTAGALGDGEQIWVLAKVSDVIRVAEGDVVEKYLLLSNSHDGRGSVSIRYTPIRVVCQNTLNLALKGGTGVTRIRHSKRVSQRLLEAQADEIEHLARVTFRGAAALFGELARRHITTSELEIYLDSLFPKTVRQRELEEVPDRWGRIMHQFESTNGNPRSVRGTWWAAYNAVIFDEDHRETRERSTERRLARIWFGSGCDLKIGALRLAATQSGTQL